METRNDPVDFLLLHLLRSTPVMQEAHTRLEVDDFINPAHQPHQLLWAVASDYWGQYNRMAPKEYLLLEVRRRLMGDVAALGYSEPAVVELADWCWRSLLDTELNPEWALRALGELLYESRVTGRAEQIISEHGRIPQKLWEALQVAEASCRIVTSSGVTPFGGDGASEKLMFETVTRQPTGVTFFDLALGGGVRSKQLYGLLAPSGGGKTVLSVQIGLECARRGKRVLLFTYEEEWGPDYKIRFNSYAGRIPRSDLEHVSDISELEPAAQARWRQANKEFGDRLVVMDMTKEGVGFGGVNELGAILDRERANGRPVDAIIIDWFWPMVQRSLSAREAEGRKGGKMEIREYAQKLLTDLKVMLVRQNVWALVTQQAEAAKATSKKALDWNQSAELKSFAFLTTNCLAVNSMDEEGVCLLNCQKARSSKRTAQWIKLEGELSRFISTSHEYTWDPRRRNYVQQGTENMVADEADDVKLGAAAKMEETYSAES